MITNGRWRRIAEVVPLPSVSAQLAIGYASENTTSTHSNFLIPLMGNSIPCSRALRGGNQLFCVSGRQRVSRTSASLYSKIEKYVYSLSGNKHRTAAGEDCILALVLVYSYSKIKKYVYSLLGNKHRTAAGEDCILALVLVYS